VVPLVPVAPVVRVSNPTLIPTYKSISEILMTRRQDSVVSVKALVVQVVQVVSVVSVVSVSHLEEPAE
jgi:hypothetical protein